MTKIWLLETQDYDYSLHGIFSSEELATEARKALIEENVRHWRAIAIRGNSDPDASERVERENADAILQIREETVYGNIQEWIADNPDFGD
jgi:hypothetical protein